MGPISCLETSGINYHYSLRNDTEECSSQLLRGGSLKSGINIPDKRYSGEKKKQNDHSGPVS